MNVGDMLGSGTISGPTVESRGSFLELSENGKNAIKIGGEERTFLLDGDQVTLRGCCGEEDGLLVGFGESVGQIHRAVEVKN